MTNPLCPIVALLVLSPHPLRPADIASTLGYEEADVAMALALLVAAGRAVVAEDRYTAPTTPDVLQDAVSAVRASHRERWVSKWHDRLHRALDIGPQPATMGA